MKLQASERVMNLSVNVVIGWKGHVLICLYPAGALSKDPCTESMLLEVDET